MRYSSTIESVRNQIHEGRSYNVRTGENNSKRRLSYEAVVKLRLYTAVFSEIDPTLFMTCII